MGRRQLAGRDMKIAQGHRRDAFFAQMRRQGGVPRMPNQAPESPAQPTESVDVSTEAEAVPTEAEADGSTPA